MSIGVYRIYISHGWGDGWSIAQLTSALDAFPAFLYRLDRVSAEDLCAAADDDDRLRAAVRVAMTQSHVMLRPIDAARTPTKLARVELDLARCGFRRRIPVLGVTTSETDAEDQPKPDGVDCLVRLQASALVCAIQDKAEEAAAGRRQANVIALAIPSKGLTRAQSPEQAGRVPGVTAFTDGTAITDGTAVARRVPVLEIVDAYHRLIGSRRTL